MRLNVSCLLTAERDFSYFETFWSEFKPENGQLAQNKADSKLTPAVSHPVVYCICFIFVLYLCCTWIVFSWRKKQYLCRWKAYTGGFPSCRHNFKVELWSVHSLWLHHYIKQHHHLLLQYMHDIFAMYLDCICVHQRSFDSLASSLLCQTTFSSSSLGRPLPSKRGAGGVLPNPKFPYQKKLRIFWIFF